eukprot:s187_g31.t1
MIALSVGSQRCCDVSLVVMPFTSLVQSPGFLGLAVALCAVESLWLLTLLYDRRADPGRARERACTGRTLGNTLEYPEKVGGVMWGPKDNCCAVDVSVDQTRPLDHVRWFQRVGAAPRPTEPQPPVAPLVTLTLRCVKWWLKQRQIPRTKEGGLPTVAWLLMAVHVSSLKQTNHEALSKRRPMAALLSSLGSFFRHYQSLERLDGVLYFSPDGSSSEFRIHENSMVGPTELNKFLNKFVRLSSIMPVPHDFDTWRANLEKSRSTQVSHSFQAIIDQLVQQHLTEITELSQLRVSNFEDSHRQLILSMKKRLADENRSAPMSPQSSAMEKAASFVSFSQLELDNSTRNRTSFSLGGAVSGSMQSLQSASGNNSLTGSASLAKKFRHHALEARRCFAELETVLEAMDFKDETAEQPGSGFKKNVEKFGSDFARLPCWDRFYIWLQSHRFDMLITSLLCVNVIWMGLELQYSGAWTGVKLGVFKDCSAAVRKFWKNCMNYIDVIVTLASLLQLVISTWTNVNPVLFRILRIGKLARALRVVTMSNTLASLELLTKCLQSSVDMLFWSFCLLTGIQCVAGMVVSALSRDFIEDETQNETIREDAWHCQFANWGPPCRVVVENISEWFSVFFLLYRCVLGFAVLNVVNAVFVQQTMKTASSDEELAFKQKERDVAMYTRKVRKLFNSMDETGDGCLNLEEFQKLAQSPKLKFWMSQLEPSTFCAESLGRKFNVKMEHWEERSWSVKTYVALFKAEATEVMKGAEAVRNPITDELLERMQRDNDCGHISQGIVKTEPGADVLYTFSIDCGLTTAWRLEVFLDNGDGEITPTEFIEGASRLRGSAKAVDIWRLETKVEVLMGEVLKTLAKEEEEGNN